jgi:hypothetical protein
MVEGEAVEPGRTPGGNKSGIPPLSPGLAAAMWCCTGSSAVIDKYGVLEQYKGFVFIFNRLIGVN